MKPHSSRVIATEYSVYNLPIGIQKVYFITI